MGCTGQVLHTPEYGEADRPCQYGAVWVRSGVPTQKTAVPEARLSTADWEAAALDALAENGLAGVAIEPLARRLGVTKGSFYWHFTDRDALLAALKERKILGAGLDVFHQEPLAPDDPILSLPNVVLSPHNAGQTPEVIRDGLLRAVENVEHYLQGKPRDVVVAPVR